MKSLVEHVDKTLPADTTPADKLALAGYIAARALGELPYELRLMEFEAFFLALFEAVSEREKGTLCH